MSTRIHNGARVSRRPAWPVPPINSTPQRLETLGGAAYVLAKANEHKPWARRWLRLNGHFV